MLIVRVEDATFSRSGVALIEPFSLEADAGARATLQQPGARAASIAARIVAGIVKPTTGAVYIGDYDARLQPAQAKRLVGFVPAGGFLGSQRDFARSIAFRADVWNIDTRLARRRAEDVRRLLGGALDAYACAVALALIPDVALIVLDQPPPGLMNGVAEVGPAAALVALFAADRVSALAPPPALVQSFG